jgi:hypothetical protein
MNWDRLSSWRWQEPADAASDQMLQLQLGNLELRFQMIDRETLTDHEKARYDEIAAALDHKPSMPASPAVAASDQTQSRSASDAIGQVQAPTWDDAYRLESAIASLLHGDRLLEAIDSALRSAISDHVPEAADLQNAYVNLTKPTNGVSKATDDVLRDFLLDAMEAIHWSSKRKYIMRKVRAQAARRTLCLGLIALLIAITPYLFFSSGAQPAVKPVSLASFQGAAFDPTAPSHSGAFWDHFALYTAVTFGFLGALFSRLITLQTQWSALALDELYNARTYHFIILRASIGIVGAFIIYFFLQSGLIKGSVFPIFDDLTMKVMPLTNDSAGRWPQELVLPSADLALLIMWSFIAGFSESLVPSVLSNTEQQFQTAVSARK